MKYKYIILIFLHLLIGLATALFEDQTGKYDWRRQFVGEIIFANFNKRSVLVSTAENVIAQLDLQKGEIDWRHVFEQSSNEEKTASHLFVLHKNVISLSADGRHLRCWDQSHGILKWEIALSTEPSSNVDLVELSDGSVCVLSGCVISNFDVKTGEKNWQSNMGDSKRVCLSLVISQDALYLTCGHSGRQMSVLQINQINGAKISEKSLAAEWLAAESCLTVGADFVCLSDYGTSITSVQLTQTELSPTKLDFDTSQLVSFNSDKYFGAFGRNSNKMTIFSLGTKIEKVVEVSNILAATVANAEEIDYLAVVSSDSAKKQQIVWYELPSGKPKTEWSMPISFSEQNAPIKRIFASVGDERYVLAIGQDHTAWLYTNEEQPAWWRPDGLTSVLSVEMVDLPLSEAQANIESEFSTSEDVVTMLSRRLTTQITQIRRALLKAGEEILSLTGLIGNEAIEQLLNAVRDKTSVHSHSSDTISIQQRGSAFERDYFNFHKVIVATTTPGKVFGLDNRRGAVLWEIWLADIEPLITADGTTNLPLFIQRTTAHFPYPAQCVLVGKSKKTGNAVVVAFDPMTGRIVDEQQYELKLKQVTLSPYVNDKQIHAVLLAGEKQVIIYPSDANVRDKTPSFLMFANETDGLLTGHRMVLESQGKGTLETVWQTPLPLVPGQKLIHIIAKRFTERVHSQGRVLGDRSVLYKYVNPNLIALAALQSDSAMVKEPQKTTGGQLSLYLVDAVTGQVVFSARHLRAAGPVHLVHCENWITYSYWNEKGRRTEMNVLELYEGAIQTDPDQFSSMAPALNLPLALKQAYIFPQGISAIGVTNTDRGLTYRLLLIAMPFGGILELPKALVDPRRPLVPTMEHKEEGLIPYIPELPVATEQIVNYNQSVLRVRGIYTAPSGLESTSLILAYGMDMYFTRLTPSGTFDILKDDFDHYFISAVLLALILASIISKKLAKHRDLKQAWR